MFINNKKSTVLIHPLERREVRIFVCDKALNAATGKDFNAVLTDQSIKCPAAILT